jgi:predicted  nucleic acid-binding Zn-ribbon protein
MMTEAQLPEPANHTLALLRGIDKKLDRLIDAVARHDVRLGRVERDLNEVKSDLVLLENKILTQTNEIISAVQRIDEHQKRFKNVLEHDSSTP